MVNNRIDSLATPQGRGPDNPIAEAIEIGSHSLVQGNFIRSHGLAIRAASDSIISGNYFKSCGTVGSSVPCVVDIRRSNIKPKPDEYDVNTLIANNQFVDCPSSILLMNYFPLEDKWYRVVRGLVVTGNHVLNSGSLLVSRNLQNSVVSDNYVYNSGEVAFDGVIVQLGNSHVKYVNNVFYRHHAGITSCLSIRNGRAILGGNTIAGYKYPYGNSEIGTVGLSPNNYIASDEVDGQLYRASWTLDPSESKATWEVGDMAWGNSRDTDEKIGWLCVAPGTSKEMEGIRGTKDSVEPNRLIVSCSYGGFSNAELTGSNGAVLHSGEYITVGEQKDVYRIVRMIETSDAPVDQSGGPASAILVLDKEIVGSPTAKAVRYATPSFEPLITDSFRRSAGSPMGLLTPLYLGEEVLDTANQRWYKAVGADDSDWKALND